MVGSVLSGRYELLENIGAGGMAIVYKAKCRLLNRNVAVKILRPEFQEDEEFLKRFTTEAQAAASLSHPNVVSVYDVGKHGKLSYIVMECIEGITLKEYMQRKGTLSVNEAVDFSMQIASALEHAHTKGIIHRDIKPHNIIITNDGVLKVTDFGLARAVSASTTVVGGSAIGSVHYVSPEQARGGFTDERSDIYSLGVVMYEMFTGTLPFDGDTPIAVAMQHISDAPEAPTIRNAQIPPEIEKIILKAMEKDVRNRYTSVGELLADMRAIFESDAPVVHADKFSTKKLPKITEEKPKPEEPKPKKKRKKEDTVAVIAAILTAVLIIGVIGFIVARKAFPSSGEKIEVPLLLNMSLEDAKTQYKDFKIEEKEKAYSSTIPEGFIMEQDKEEGEWIRKGDTVFVVISRGMQEIELKDFTDEHYRDVEAELKDLGLEVQISEENSDDIREGNVIRTNPNAGYVLRTGDTVILYVSCGRSSVEVSVPPLVGKSEEEARATLKTAGLSIGSVTSEPDSQKKGTVIKQSIENGTQVSSGTAVDIVLSSGEAEEPVQEGTHTLRIELPQDRESANVKVLTGTHTLFEGEFETALSPVTINLTDKVGSAVVDIYVDDEIYKSNVPVTFE